MLVSQQTLGGFHVFSVLLELPEFEVVNQEIFSSQENTRLKESSILSPEKL
jgi:hypothetical protein